MENVTTIGQIDQLLTFSWLDYTFFFGLFGVSAVIGIYFGCFGTKQSTTKEYLLGGKQMNAYPIGMSLIASTLSGVTLLGIPAEVYMFGTQYWACIISTVAIVLSKIYVFLPVFHKLQVKTSFQYLQMRFGNSIKTAASLMFAINVMLYIPIVVYVPALAFNQVTGINVHVITPVVCLICIFYTTLGGLKAVVWTDTFQLSITILAMFAIFLLDSVNIGGIGEIWKKADESGRIEFFNLDFDPTSRCTFWSVAIGMSIMWIAQCSVNPAIVQRYIALPSLKDAKKSVLVFCVGVIITKSLSCFSGLIMYYKYHDCDPITSGKVKRMDQMLPYYVLDVATPIPGLSGIFVSGVCSTALSTMSTFLNTLAGTIYEDFLVPSKMVKLSEPTANILLKSLVVTIGSICVAMVFFIEKLGGVLQVSMSFAGITGGPLLGVFMLGMLFPYANTKGALWGSCTSFLFVSWMYIGQQMSHLQGSMKNVAKPLSVAGCEYFLNSTVNTTTTVHLDSIEEPFWLYRVSFYWYSFIGLAITIFVGLIVSHFTRKKTDPPAERDLLSPCIYGLLTKNI